MIRDTFKNLSSLILNFLVSQFFLKLIVTFLPPGIISHSRVVNIFCPITIERKTAAPTNIPITVMTIDPLRERKITIRKPCTTIPTLSPIIKTAKQSLCTKPLPSKNKFLTPEGKAHKIIPRATSKLITVAQLAPIIPKWRIISELMAALTTTARIKPTAVILNWSRL